MPAIARLDPRSLALDSWPRAFHRASWAPLMESAMVSDFDLHSCPHCWCRSTGSSCCLKDSHSLVADLFWCWVFAGVVVGPIWCRATFVTRRLIPFLSSLRAAVWVAPYFVIPTSMRAPSVIATVTVNLVTGFLRAVLIDCFLFNFFNFCYCHSNWRFVWTDWVEQLIQVSFEWKIAGSAIVVGFLKGGLGRRDTT